MRAREFIYIVEGYNEAIAKYVNAGNSPDTVKTTIADYKKVKHKLPKEEYGDIDVVAKNIDFKTLQQAVEDAKNITTKTQIKKGKVKGEFHVLYEKDPWLIVIPLDKKASCAHGRNTNWCTTKIDQRYYEQYFYENKVTLIYFINSEQKVPRENEDNSGQQNMVNAKWAISVPTNRESVEFFDLYDNSINEDQFQEQTGFDPNKFIDKAVSDQVQQVVNDSRKAWGELVKQTEKAIKNEVEKGKRNEKVEKMLADTLEGDTIKEYVRKVGKMDYPQHMQMIFVNADVTNGRFITNLTEKTQMSMIQNFASSLAYMDNPFPSVIEAAVMKNGFALGAIKNPSYDIQKKAVTAHPGAIKYVQNPPEELQRIAVTKQPKSINYIKNPSDEMQILAVKNDPDAIEYIDRPIEKVQLIILDKKPELISFVKNPTERVQKLAIERFPKIIQTYISKGLVPTEEMQMQAVMDEEYGVENLRYMRAFGVKMPIAVQKAIVEKNGNLISLIDDPSEQIQLLAVQNDPGAIEYIKNPVQLVIDYTKSLESKKHGDYISKVMDDWKYIKQVNNPSEALQMLAIEQDPIAILSIENPTEKAQLMAVEKEPTYIKFIKNPSESAQIAAVKKDKNSYNYIRNPSAKVKNLLGVGK